MVGNDTQEYIYDAFISYRHLPLDTAIATAIHKKLEHYYAPKNVFCVNTRKIKRVFLDSLELPTSANLNSGIQEALQHSRYLILICSEQTKYSKWCMQEIKLFKELHGGNTENILTVLVSGDPTNVFPDVLRWNTKTIINRSGDSKIIQEEIEPLAANVTAPSIRKSLKRLSIEFLRVAAPILGCSFDDLYQRDRRRKIKRTVAAVFSGSILISAITLSAIIGLKAIEQRDEQLEAASSEISTYEYTIVEKDKTINEQEIDIMLKQAQNALEEGNKAQSLLIAKEIIENSPINNDTIKSRIEAILRQSTYIQPYTKYAAIECNGFTDIIYSEYDSVIVAARDRAIEVYSVKNGFLLKKAEISNTPLLLVVDDGIIYSYCIDNTLSLYNMDDLSLIDSFPILKDKYTPDSMYKCGNKIYLCGELFGVSVECVDLQTKQSYFPISSGNKSVYCKEADIIAIMNSELNLESDIHINEFSLYDVEKEEMLATKLPTACDIKIIRDIAGEIVDDFETKQITYNSTTNELVFLSDLFDSNGYILNYLMITCINLSDLSSLRVIFLENYNEQTSDFPLSRTQDIIRENSFLALGDWYGRVIAVNIDTLETPNSYENIKYGITNNNGYCYGFQQEQTKPVKKLCFLDDRYLAISFQGVDSSVQLLAYSNHTLKEPTLENVNGELNILRAIDGKSFITWSLITDISIFSLAPSVYQTSSILTIDDLMFTGNSDNVGVEATADEFKVKAVSPDKAYRLVVYSTEEEPTYYFYEHNYGYYSYWVTDNTTNELLYNANICQDAAAVDIMDDTIACVLLNTGTIEVVNMRTGEIIHSTAIDFPLGFDLKFEVDFNHNRMFIATCENLSGVLYNYGHIYSLTDGSLLFDFSSFDKDLFLGTDFILSKIYFTDLENITEFTIPDYDELLSMMDEFISN